MIQESTIKIMYTNDEPSCCRPLNKVVWQMMKKEMDQLWVKENNFHIYFFGLLVRTQFHNWLTI